jgi:Protein of unknown function (DUF3048) N-terminal domain/Protein of unknown function (DUF3048) C-terminal domain
MPGLRGFSLACAVIVGGAALSGCGGSKHAAAPPVATTTSSPSPSPTPVTNPFTGTTTGLDKPVLAVKIDNTTSSKPQLGLRSADIVYVEQVEGGLTRVMAIFSSHLPARVGPVRSARISDLHLLPQFGKPAFGFSGIQSKMIPYVARASVVDVSADKLGGEYFRAGGNPAPYNLYTSPKALLAHASGASRSHDIGFRFGPAPAGGKPTTKFKVNYPAASFSFTWSAKAKRWLVDQDGSEDRAAEGGQLGGQTIVVQYAKTTRSQFHDFHGNYTPLIGTTGTGRAVVLRDGQAFDARWSRPSETAGTTFTTATGQPMTFATGQVWVVLANDGKPITP